MRKYEYPIVLLFTILVIGGLVYLVSNSNKAKCLTDGIDWQAAVLALVLYNNEHGIEGIDFHNMDQAEIEHHFEENCQQDMQIYNDFLDEHSLR